MHGVFESIRLDIALERRRSRMMVETLRLIRNQLWYMEQSPTRETIRMMIDAALAREEPCVFTTLQGMVMSVETQQMRYAEGEDTE